MNRVGVNQVGVNQAGVNPFGVNQVRMNKGVSAVLEQYKQEREKAKKAKESKESKLKVTKLLVLGISLFTAVLILHIIKSSKDYWRAKVEKDSVVRRDGLWGSCVKKTEVGVNEECKSAYSVAVDLLKTIQATDIITYILLVTSAILNGSACFYGCKGKLHVTPEKVAFFCLILAVLVQSTKLISFIIDTYKLPDSSTVIFEWGFYVEFGAIFVEIGAAFLIQREIGQWKKKPTQSLSVIVSQQFQPIPMMQLTDGRSVQQIPMMQTEVPVTQIPMMQTEVPVQQILMQPTEVPVPQIPMQPSNSVPMYTMF